MASLYGSHNVVWPSTTASSFGFLSRQRMKKCIFFRGKSKVFSNDNSKIKKTLRGDSPEMSKRKGYALVQG